LVAQVVNPALDRMGTCRGGTLHGVFRAKSEQALQLRPDSGQLSFFEGQHGDAIPVLSQWQRPATGRAAIAHQAETPLRKVMAQAGEQTAAGMELAIWLAGHARPGRVGSAVFDACTGNGQGPIRRPEPLGFENLMEI
jgi:hypothetical protein